MAETKRATFDREKATPARVIPVPHDMSGKVPLFRSYVGCPRCEFEVNPWYNYCPKCGQRLLWEDK